MISSDVIILGGGMAGVSLAAALASRAVTVTVVEVDEHLGRHATGRSAAVFFENYGNETVRSLTRASRNFLLHPPTGFSETPLMRPRAAMFVADKRASALLEDVMRTPGMQRLTASEAIARVPILSPEWVTAAVLDDSGFDVDVSALLHGYLALARRAGATIVTGANFSHPRRVADKWQVETRVGSFESTVLVNAAGAWADEVASSAGAQSIGLSPRRRSAVTFAAPPGMAIGEWPIVTDPEETFYFKPDAGQILLSPANEDAAVPADVVPDEMDVAIAIDRFERATTMQVERVSHRWAGLRTFAADRTPIVGFDPRVPRFFWLAGQGGYGIQTAPALAALATALILDEPLPAHLTRAGITPSSVAADRPSLAHSSQAERRMPSGS